MRPCYCEDVVASVDEAATVMVAAVAGSMMTVRVEVEVKPSVSVAT